MSRRHHIPPPRQMRVRRVVHVHPHPALRPDVIATPAPRPQPLILRPPAPQPDIISPRPPPQLILPAGIAAAVQGADVVSGLGIGQALQGLQQTAGTILDAASDVLVPAFAPDQYTKAQLQASDPWLFANDLQRSRNKRELMQVENDVQPGGGDNGMAG